MAQRRKCLAVFLFPFGSRKTFYANQLDFYQPIFGKLRTVSLKQLYPSWLYDSEPRSMILSNFKHFGSCLLNEHYLFFSFYLSKYILPNVSFCFLKNLANYNLITFASIKALVFVYCSKRKWINSTLVLL